MALRTTVSKSTKSGKVSRLSGAIAIQMAKQRNDPTYVKMLRHKNKYFEYKNKLRQKYGRKGRQEALKKR